MEALMATKKKPSQKWVKEMIADEKAGIKQYGSHKGFTTQKKQEQTHLKKLQRMLKRK